MCNSDIITVTYEGQVIEAGTHSHSMGLKEAYYLHNTVQLCWNNNPVLSVTTNDNKHKHALIIGLCRWFIWNNNLTYLPVKSSWDPSGLWFPMSQSQTQDCINAPPLTQEYSCHTHFKPEPGLTATVSLCRTLTLYRMRRIIKWT